MPDFNDPQFRFYLISYLIAAVFLIIAGIAFKGKVRLETKGTWLAYILLGPLPILIGPNLTSLFQLPTNGVLPATAMTIFVGIVFIHYILPAIAGDFQTEKLLVSAYLAVLLGLSVAGVGWVMGIFTEFVGNEYDSFGVEVWTLEDQTEWPGE